MLKMSYITQSLEIDLKLPLAVVVHDAGAANLIAAWLKKMSIKDIRLSSDGPALSIFACEFPQLTNISLADALKDANTLLSGTSNRQSKIEHEARDLARKQGIYSISVLDHWVNYANRFVREERQVLPDEIWVSDEIAFSIAQNSFHSTLIRQLPNSYLEQLVKKINANQLLDVDGKTHVLYALEPIYEKWSNYETPGEFQALDFFISKLELLGFKNNTKIILRPHPSDPKGKYNEWIHLHNHLDISVDITQTLCELIAWADWVVGCETYAMVIALHANKQILSTLPPWAPLCRLPQKNIRMLRAL
jgi:hypothetical protein